MTHDTFSASDWHTEINQQIKQQIDSKRPLVFDPSPEQAYYIVAARDAGVQWVDIAAYCESRGWDGAETTMRRFYKRQKGK